MYLRGRTRLRHVPLHTDGRSCFSSHEAPVCGGKQRNAQPSLQTFAVAAALVEIGGLLNWG